MQRANQADSSRLLEPVRLNGASFKLTKEVSMVLSQWLSSSPPERKRLPKKPTEERFFMVTSYYFPI